MQTLLDGGSFFEGSRWHEGRWWVSDFYRHLVLAIDPDGRSKEVLRVEGQPSGLGWMPDGSLSDRRIWAQLAPTPPITTFEETLGQLKVGSDGCGLDAEGHIWEADEVGARCIRVAPGGEIVDERSPPPRGRASGPTCSAARTAARC